MACEAFANGRVNFPLLFPLLHLPSPCTRRPTTPPIDPRREIAALQAENYNLERQVFSYQKSISYASARGQPSEDLPEDYYANHVRRLSETQSLSESEYA